MFIFIDVYLFFLFFARRGQGKDWVVSIKGTEKPADAGPKEVQKVENDGRSVVVVEVT